MTPRWLDVAVKAMGAAAVCSVVAFAVVIAFAAAGRSGAEVSTRTFAIGAVVLFAVLALGVLVSHDERTD